MCGWIDAAQKQGELREYKLVAQQYQRRFGMRFDIPLEEYKSLMKDLGNMLNTLGFELVSEDDEEDEPAAAMSEASSAGKSIVKTLLWVAAAVVVGVAIAMALS